MTLGKTINYNDAPTFYYSTQLRILVEEYIEMRHEGEVNKAKDLKFAAAQIINLAGVDSERNALEALNKNPKGVLEWLGISEWYTFFSSVYNSPEGQQRLEDYRKAHPGTAV